MSKQLQNMSEVTEFHLLLYLHQIQSRLLENWYNMEPLRHGCYCVLIKTNIIRKEKSNQIYPMDVLKPMFLKTISKYNGSKQLYTDASKTDKGVSIGMWDDTVKRSLNANITKNTCIMFAEFTAIFLACEYTSTQLFKRNNFLWYLGWL